MHLLIRADASTQIGAGHVMRCLALAQAWQESGGSVTFAMAEMPAQLAVRLQNEGINLHTLSTVPGSAEDADQTTAAAAASHASAIIIDGYRFGAGYQKQIKNARIKVLFIDDNGHADHYYADFVLNQNAYAREALYTRREPDTRLLLGSEFTLLRREFRQWREWPRIISPMARKVLVTMGGGDPENVTQTIIEMLDEIKSDPLEIVVVVGSGNPHYDALLRRVQISSHRIKLKQHVDDMPGQMAWADLAISGGGSTSWEMAFMGLPAVLLIIAENQAGIVDYLLSHGVVCSLGRPDKLDIMEAAGLVSELMYNDERRQLMSTRGRQLIDGLGAARVVAALMESV